MVASYEQSTAEKQATKAAIEGTLSHLKDLRNYEMEQVAACANYQSMLGPPVSRNNEQEYLRHVYWQEFHHWTARILQSQIDDLESELNGCLPWDKGRCPRCRARLTPSTSENLSGEYRNDMCECCQRETL